jgi:hypothetical protein
MYRRWYAYSKARDMMLDHTDSKHAPWHLVRSNDKRRARLNIISHILQSIPYKRTKHKKVDLPKRSDTSTSRSVVLTSSNGDIHARPRDRIPQHRGGEDWRLEWL